jgi:N-alpha-acetyltransferase 35, NatC auxiliary subunit
LPVGDLVIQEDFSLFESVSAVEIMDPKMDSGLLLPEEALEDHYDINSDITPADAIGIMDQLICHEMAWHAGYPLARTLFTSHHIDRLLSSDGRQMDDFQFQNDPSALLSPNDRELRPLVHKVLRAYCIGLIKCCGCGLEEIERSWAPFYDEEDFSMNTCGRQLLASVSVEQVNRQLIAAMDWANEQHHQASSVRLELSWKAIAIRLKARSLMVIALAGPPSGVSSDSWQITWLSVSQEIPNVKLSHDLGHQVLGAFSSKIQRRLASTSPLRPVVETSFEEACSMWERLATDCILAWSNSLVVSESKQMGPIKVRIYP